MKIVMLKLNEVAKQFLLSQIFLHPLFDVEFADHITLNYNPTEDELEPYLALEGQQIFITVEAVGRDKNIQAVVVELPDDLECANDIPHITISANRGVRPVTSNTMLQTLSNIKDLREPFTLETTLVIEER